MSGRLNISGGNFGPFGDILPGATCLEGLEITVGKRHSVRDVARIFTASPRKMGSLCTQFKKKVWPWAKMVCTYREFLGGNVLIYPPQYRNVTDPFPAPRLILHYPTSTKRPIDISMGVNVEKKQHHFARRNYRARFTRDTRKGACPFLSW